MSTENPAPPPPAAPHALIRIPVRIVVLVLILPVRMTWDALKTTARFLDRTVLRPLGRTLGLAAAWLGRLVAWPFVMLWRYVIVVPVVWLYGAVLAPLGRGLAWVFTGLGRGIGWLLTVLGRAVAWPLAMLWRYVIVAPVVWLYGAVLAPLGRGIGWLLTRTGHGLAWVFTGLGRGLAWFFGGIWQGLAWAGAQLGRALAVAARWTGIVVAWPFAALWRYLLVPFVTYGIVRPAGWLWRRVLAPLGREVRDAVGICWRAAGFVSRAVGRAIGWALRILLVRPLAWLGRNLVRRPAAWAYRQVCTPVGHWIRDAVWTPARTALAQARHATRTALAQARDTVRRARQDAWRALVGGAEPDRGGEPQVAGARTLGSTTNVPGAVPAPEISLHKQG
ncbi:hypothetical protein [Streptomyces sp. NPDC051909]|uniref:hypothetical protein n=1 Tax=Streptomyces sp. NPDC051909 TaxID=3154944 RepID=UPI0034321E16